MLTPVLAEEEVLVDDPLIEDTEEELKIEENLEEEIVNIELEVIETKELELEEDVEEVLQEEVKEADVVNEEILIEDPILRKMINGALNKGFIDDRHPSREELASITSLILEDKVNWNGNAYLNSVEGLEYLVNLEEIRVMRTFVPQEFFTKLSELPKLKVFRFHNSYTSGNVSTVALRNSLVNGENMERVPFDPVMKLGALGSSQSIEVIEIAGSYLEYLPNYQHRVRGILNIDGLGNLKTIKELTIGEFRAVDDERMNFLSGLNNLEYFRVVEAPFTNIDAINDLPESTAVSINHTAVKDYTNVRRSNLNNQRFSHNTFVLDA